MALIQQLAEHFDAGADGFLGHGQADDFDLFTDLDDAALDPARDHGAAAGDGEHVFDRHEEGAIDRALGLRDVGVERVGQLHDGLFAQRAFVAFKGEFGRAVHDGGLVAGEVVFVEQLAHFHLDEFEQLGVVNHVALVEEHDDVGHTHLARQQDVFARLGHRAVGGGADQNGTVHLRGTGDHVFHIVGVAGAIDVGVVAAGGLVLNVGGVDGDAARFFFGCGVDLVVGLGLAAKLGCQHGGDGRRERGFAVVNVTDGAYVDVRLGPLEFFLCHDANP